MPTRVLAGLIAAVVTASGAAASPLDDADAAYQRGDYATALKIIGPLAAQGNVSAQVDLGTLYSSGRGVPLNDAEALMWYRRAAEKGWAEAETKLGAGAAYYSGRGVKRDYAEAVKWYQLAAEQGDASAQFSLGGMYGTGQGVPQDFVFAHMWFNLAASHGVKDAAQERDDTADLMTPDQIAEAQRMAREWKPTPAH
jgi:TPR repeat protein